MIRQCLPKTSSKMFPPAEDGNKYRDPYPDNMQRVRDLNGRSPTNLSTQDPGNPVEEEEERV